MDGARSMIDLAKAIIPELPCLLAEEAGQTEALLAELITRSAAVEGEILAVLQRHPATREWAYAQLGSEAALRDSPGAYFPLQGAGSAPASNAYGCRKCDYRWRRRAVGQAVPLCPTHEIPLARRPDSER